MSPKSGVEGDKSCLITSRFVDLMFLADTGLATAAVSWQPWRACSTELRNRRHSCTMEFSVPALSGSRPCVSYRKNNKHTYICDVPTTNARNLSVSQE